MSELKLGKLEKINDLRATWPNEEHDFTPWLAEEENIKILGDELGIPIKVVQKEAPVGKFELDILAVDENTNENIVIENQLEATDHIHFGKLLMYGAGYDASTMIWIVKDVCEEYKQAVEWLNEHSDPKINIFLVKIELFKIGDSEKAPHFEIVSQPNDWTKTIRNNFASTELKGAKLIDLNFWQNFVAYCRERKVSFTLRKARPQHWYDISTGARHAFIRLTILKTGDLSCCLWIDDKELFTKLEKSKEEIEAKIKYPLKWDYKENSIACSINIDEKYQVDLNSENLDDGCEWLVARVEELRKIFVKYF